MKILKTVALVPLLIAVGLGASTSAVAKSVSKAKTSVSGKHKKAAGHKATARSTSKSRKALARSSRVRAIRNVSYSRPAAVLAAPALSFGEQAGLNTTHDPLDLESNAAFVIDADNSRILFDKNSDAVLPIASLSKLMTSVVVLEAHQDLNEMIEVTEDDVDHIKHTSSRLRVGSVLSRSDMLHIALMSSENRAASALGRNYPGGLPAFVMAMNAKAKELGMTNTHYVEPTGLSYENVSTARDLSRLVKKAYSYSLIRDYSTDSSYRVEPGRYALQYNTSNHLIASDRWDIGLQKTGFINEAGHCMLMQATIDGTPTIMVFLDSRGKNSRFADADRVKHWIDKNHPGTETGNRALQARS